MGVIHSFVEELANPDKNLRFAAEDVLANIAEDPDGDPARAIADAVATLLRNMQSETPLVRQSAGERVAPRKGVHDVKVESRKSRRKSER